jgi:hypothetical protein
MSEKRVLLDTAAFLAWPGAGAIAGVPVDTVRTIAQHFLQACYQDLGTAPRLLDGEELGQLLRELLPRHFGVRDPLAPAVEEVLAAYLGFLGETQLVPAMFELRAALDRHAQAFRDAVQSGAAHRGGVAVTGPGRTVAHRADKTGRNDPCPCGSGKKFKKCCMGLRG